MKQKKLLSVLLAGAMVVSGGSISGLEGIIPEVVAAASSTEWNGQPGVFQVNREAARSTFYSFDTAEKAKAKAGRNLHYYQLLNGDDWKFSWAVKPADRIGAKDANFNQKDYDEAMPRQSATRSEHTARPLQSIQAGKTATFLSTSKVLVLPCICG